MSVSLLIILLGFGALLWPAKVQVIRVVDGDSIEVLERRRPVRVRIANLDAPEYRQPGGRESRAALALLLRERSVRLCLGRTDIYGRRVARVLVGYTPVDWLMISRGHAWPTSALGGLLTIRPRLCRLGIWSQSGAVHPSLWRRANRPAP